MLLLVALLFFAVSASFADSLYYHLDAGGTLHIAKRPIHKESRFLLGTAPVHRSSVKKHRVQSPPEEWNGIISALANRYHIDPALVRSIVQVESGFNPNAVSPKGAVGLMQLMPKTAERYFVTDRSDPYQNIHGGIQYLKDLFARFDRLPFVLAAYNAGENAVLKYGDIPPFPETQQYVAKVLHLYHGTQ